MREIKELIWQEGEYSYPAAYGFVPSISGYIHDEDNSDRDCMLVVPGGGYCMCTPHEGELVAEVFYKQGMNAFVLTYTTDITMSVPLMKQPLEDISRAVRFIRKRAEELNINGKKLFISGFSAGAHVCGSLAVHYDDVADKDTEYAGISNKPDGVILAYPVITTGEYTHIYSVQTLLGKEPSDEDLSYFSLEKNVTKDTPPCFIWQTVTDDLVPVENSYLMAEALRIHGVPFAHYVFPSGFHGLSYPSEKFFSFNAGGEYVLEQLEKAVAAVKAGNGINVSEQRKKELEEQFPDILPEGQSQKNIEQPKGDAIQAGEDSKAEDGAGDVDQAVDMLPPLDMTWSEDIGLWPELARVWMNRI